MRVSNPDLFDPPTAARLCGAGPARTRQAATSVAPFQLAYTVVEPSLLGETAIAGSVGGCAFHWNRYAR